MTIEPQWGSTMFGMAMRPVVEPRWGSNVYSRTLTQGAPEYRRPWALELNTFGVKNQNTILDLKRRSQGKKNQLDWLMALTAKS